MPIKKFFFPKEALQGQKIPSYVIWKDLDFDKVEIEFPRCITPKEFFNVSEKIVEEQKATITGVEVPGYIGVVFSTSINTKQASTNEKVVYRFLNKGNIVHEITSVIHLFRHDVCVYGEIPSKIVFDPENGKISDKIKIRNLGQGTAIIDIQTREDSELKKVPPAFFLKWRQDFINGLQNGIKTLKSDYPASSSLLDKFESYLANPVEFNEDSLSDFKIFEQDMLRFMEGNERFATDLGQILGEALLRSREIVNLYQFILDYMNSIGREKLLVRDPFNVIQLSDKPAILKVKIQCIDLLRQVCTPMTLPDISVIGKKNSELALFKLFEWGGAINE
jgi:hypothetical protein